MWTEPVGFIVSSAKTKAFSKASSCQYLTPKSASLNWDPVVLFKQIKYGILYVLLRESNQMPPVTLLILYRTLNVVFMI